MSGHQSSSKSLPIKWQDEKFNVTPWKSLFPVKLLHFSVFYPLPCIDRPHSPFPFTLLANYPDRSDTEILLLVKTRLTGFSNPLFPYDLLKLNFFYLIYETLLITPLFTCDTDDFNFNHNHLTLVVIFLRYGWR